MLQERCLEKLNAKLLTQGLFSTYMIINNEAHKKKLRTHLSVTKIEKIYIDLVRRNNQQHNLETNY